MQIESVLIEGDGLVTDLRFGLKYFTGRVDLHIVWVDLKPARERTGDDKFED